jgi:hypothetical protein
VFIRTSTHRIFEFQVTTRETTRDSRVPASLRMDAFINSWSLPIIRHAYVTEMTTFLNRSGPEEASSKSTIVYSGSPVSSMDLYQCNCARIHIHIHATYIKNIKKDTHTHTHTHIYNIFYN